MSGRIEVVCGPMFSGKTTELIRRVERARLAKLGVQVFVPLEDARSGGSVVSHAQHDLEAVGVSAFPIESWSEFRKQVRAGIKVVAIDEAQFLPSSILGEIMSLVHDGRTLILCGLDMDYRGRPFGLMPTFLAMAEKVLKLTAVCAVCGSDDAAYTHRKVAQGETVLVGDEGEYEARCSRCRVAMSALSG